MGGYLHVTAHVCQGRCVCVCVRQKPEGTLISGETRGPALVRAPSHLQQHKQRYSAPAIVLLFAAVREQPFVARGCVSADLITSIMETGT